MLAIILIIIIFMLQSFPDKEKLFAKMFVGINYEPQNNKPPIIVSGDFLNLILKQIESKSNQLSKKCQKDLLIQILSLFQTNPVNSLHIYDYDKKRQQSLLEMLVMTMLSLIQKQSDIQQFCSYFQVLTSHYLVKLRNITKLTQMLSKNFYQENFNALHFKFALKILNNYFGIKRCLQNNPPSFFYLYGDSNIGIKSVNSFTGKLKNELSAMIVFKILSKEDLFKKQRHPILLSIKSSKQDLIVFIEEEHIIIENKTLQRKLILKKTPLQINKWFRLIINLTSSQSKIYVNSQLYQQDPLISKQSERQVTSVNFGNRFSGFITSLIVSASNLQINHFSYQQFPFGIQNWETLRVLRQKNYKFIERTVITCFPFCLLQIRYKSYCIDVSQKVYSQIAQNIIAFNDDSIQSGPQYLGKPEIILPLFYLGKFYSKKAYPNLLFDLLQIIQTYIIKYNSTNKILNNFQERKHNGFSNSQILQEDFFIVMGNHISNLTSFLNQQVLTLMNKIQAKLNDDQKVYWLKHVMWNVGIYSINQPKVVRQYFLNLIKKYQNHKSISLKALGLHQLLYWTVKHFQHKARSNQKNIQAYNCCLQHYINQSILGNDLDVQEALKLDNYNYKEHYTWIETIASIIIQYMLIDEINQAAQILKSLLRFFMHKFSTCFYMLILKILKKQILKFKNDTTFIKALTNKCQIIPFLSFLSEKTINCDLVTQIVYFCLFAYQHQNQQQRLQIVDFIIQLLHRLKQFVNSKNPIGRSIQKIRKRSVDYVLIQKKSYNQIQKIKELTSRKLQTISHWYPLLIILKNFLVGVVSDFECNSLSYHFVNQDVFSLIKIYFQIAAQQYQQILLRQIQKIMNLNKVNKSFLSKSLSFNQVLLKQLFKSGIKLNLSQSISADKKNNILLRIFFQLLSHIFIENSNFNEYFYLLMQICQQSQILKLNVLVVELLQIAFKNYIPEQILTFNHRIHIYLLLQYQTRRQNIQQMPESSNEISQNQKQNEKKQFFSAIKKLKINFMVKLVQKTKQFYLQDLQSIKQAFIYQTFQLNSTIHICKYISKIYSNFQKKVPRSLRKLSNLSAETQNKQKQKSKISQKQGEVNKNINCILFDQRLNVYNQEQQQFWFDGIISKLTSNIRLYVKNSNRPKSQLIQEVTNTYLKQNEKKQVFILQIFINSLIQEIEYMQNQEVHQIEKIDIQFLLIMLSEIVSLYLITSITKENIYNNVKLLRMIIFFVSGYLSQNSMTQKKYSQLSMNACVKIWKSIICLIIHNYDQLAQQNDVTTQIQHKSCQAMKSYVDLNQYALSNQISNALIETFQFFILDQDGVQIIKSQDWIRFIKGKQTSDEAFETLIKQLITSQKFIQTITLNHQILKISQNCSKINIDALNKKFNKASASIKKRFSGDLLKIKAQGASKINRDHLFDKQNIIQEQVRLKYLHNQECKLRQFHSKWKKMWKKMRIYNQPYGLYMAMRNNSNNFKLSQSKQQIKNFKFQMSKYTSNSLIQPILQAKIIQPWHVSKQKYFQQKNQIYSLVDMMRPDQNQIKKNQSQSQNLNYKLANIWNLMLWKMPKQQKKSVQYHVVWIKGSIKARGRVMINKFQQIQFWYESIKQGDSHLSFQNFSLQFNKQTYKIWPLVSIKKIWKRRYLMKYNALELELTNSKCIFLYFKDKNQNSFLSEIAKIRQDKIFYNSNKIKLNKVSIFQNNWYQEGVDQRVVQLWKNNKISNLNYLMYLNKASSRGIYDLSQYSVVPWVTFMTNQKQPKLRDLTKTMGGLGSQQRKSLLLDKHKAKDPFNPVPAFHFGTHYSSPGVVFNFLIRVSPFTQYCKHLQGGKFDIPDRLFSSLINSWKSAYNQVSDVRQLTPQFYYLPQFLLNLENHNFGSTQSGELINNVQLPPWAASNPYFFIIQFRQILQSQTVSESINEWIDLIFGYKQRGQQAQKSFNVYYYLTYEQYSNLQDQDDQVHKKSCEAQIVHFGQIPPQLFIKPHPKRNENKKGYLQLKIINKYLLTNKISEKQKIFGISIKKQLKQLLVVKKNTLQHYSLIKNPICLTKALKINFQKSQSEVFYLLSKYAAKVQFFKSHDYFIIYGYINNEFRVYNTLLGKVEKFEIFQSLITTVFISQAEDMIFIGCQNGIVYIYQLQYQASKLYWEKIHCQTFPYSINHISQSDGFFVFSYGAYVSIYKITRTLHYLCAQQKMHKAQVKLLRSYKNSLKVRQSYIINSPLYGIVMLDNANIKVYSINGQFLKHIHCNIKKTFLIKDNQLNDYLYYYEEDRVILLSLPDLRCVSQLSIQEIHGLWKNGFMYCNSICQIGWDCLGWIK